jgi:hypothetical protein
LFDVGVVVFLVGPAAGELNGVGPAVIVEMAVDELRAVIGVDAAQAEGQGLLQLDERRLDAALMLAEDGARLHPRGVDVGDVEGMQELALGRGAGVTDEIDLREARHGDVPAIGLDGDVVLEQGARLGAAVEAFLELALLGRQPAIDLPGADGEQLALEGGRQAQAAPGAGQPEGPQGLEADGPGIAGGRPDRGERVDHGGPIEGGAPAPGPWALAGRGGAVQQPHGVLAVIAGDPGALIEDLLFLRAPRLAVARMDRLEVLPLGMCRHDVPLLGTASGPRESHIANGATIFAR